MERLLDLMIASLTIAIDNGKNETSPAGFPKKEQNCLKQCYFKWFRTN